jgi:hypothetical protein
MKKALAIGILIFLTACAEQWSATGSQGAKFQDVEPACRAKAHASALHQLPFPYDRDAGPAGFPPDTREDIERRETALCLEQHGFKLRREWR